MNTTQIKDFIKNELNGTCRDLAEQLGISRQTISNYRNGRGIRLSTFFKIVERSGRIFTLDGQIIKSERGAKEFLLTKANKHQISKMSNQYYSTAYRFFKEHDSSLDNLLYYAEVLKINAEI